MFGLRIRKGSYRNVLLTKKYAIKFPIFSSWENFLRGILCNINEVKYSTINCQHLCPVLCSYLGSFVIVMPRVKVDCSEQTRNKFWSEIEKQPYSEREVYKNIVEWKTDSVGYLGEQIVAVDYGH